jgi:molybdate transport system ATP-binding protein
MNLELHADFTRNYPGGPTIRINRLRVSDALGVVVLFGPSGSGKTTVLRCLAGLDRPESGVIRCNDETWFESARKVWVGPQLRRIGYVPQDSALFPHLTVAGNLAYGLHQTPSHERKARVTELVHWLGLSSLERRLPHELSGGQQQRVALGRALAAKPRLLLLDEPLCALDAPTRQRLRLELRPWLKECAIPTVLVTHDRSEALALGDQIVVLQAGQMLQVGPVSDVFNRPANPAVAKLVGAETVLPARVLTAADGLITVAVGEVKLHALADQALAEVRDVHVCIRAEDVVLMRPGEGHGSPRNRFEAIVKGIQNDGPLVWIELDCGFVLKALLTAQAAREMNLQAGAPVIALVKAPHVHLMA